LTPYVQPCDAGIIRTFKAKYRAKFCQRAIELDEAGEEDIYEINLLESMMLAREAWEGVTPETIANCWRHTGTLPFVGNTRFRNFELIDIAGCRAKERYREVYWAPVFKVIMDAENDTEKALAEVNKLAIKASQPRLTIQLPTRPPQLIAAEEEVANAKDEVQ
ncbi:DDE-domain-containing protein, partial [Fistulina hepatica ATCC 64428]